MDFKTTFKLFSPTLSGVLQSDKTKEWIVKGFIDAYRNIYPMTNDTKVVSKLIEIILLPYLDNFAKTNGYILELPDCQNHYPDVTIASKQDKFAIDIKTTYRIKNSLVNGMTLGSFTGYFRQRSDKKNILYPYSSYNEHYVLGIIYSRSNEIYSNETVFRLKDLKNIKTPISDFEIFFQEKYRIASDKPGSGNTKNIGSENKIKDLTTGNGIFVREFGDAAKEMFDKYWMNYDTKDMAISMD